MELPMLEPMFCDLPLDGMDFETNCSCFFFKQLANERKCGKTNCLAKEVSSDLKN